MNGYTETCLAANTLLQDGRYRIVRHISSGGFGHTYEGVHTMLDARVAIKEFFPKMFCDRDDSTHRVTVSTRTNRDLVDKLRKKFNEEAKAVCQMRHDNIVRVTDIFEENGTAYYVMDYIEGRSLQQIVGERGALPEKEAVGYVRQVADALSYVHSLHRLHLDIKPGNIMVDARGHATLIDFGASKHYDAESGENTSTLMGVNTKGYAPIEQTTQSFTRFSPATDIYALGATLYKLLTGITPPDANMLMAKEETLQPLPSWISASTRNAIKKALSPERAGRPQSIEAFLSLLDAAPVTVGDDEETKVETARVKGEAKQKTPRKTLADSKETKARRKLMDDAKREARSQKEASDAKSLRIIKKTLIVSATLGFGSLLLMGLLDNSKSKYDVYGDENSMTVSEDIAGAMMTNEINGHEYVDLGLPSGLLWATCNVGASKPEEYGDHYDWGTTRTRKGSIPNGMSIDQLVSAGILGSDGNLAPAYDAASDAWGGTWRMPTRGDIQELINKTTAMWTTVNGVTGVAFTSKTNGRSIFLPAAGFRNGTLPCIDGSCGSYWSSSPESGYSTFAVTLYFDASQFDRKSSSILGYGRSVRPVSAP